MGAAVEVGSGLRELALVGLRSRSLETQEAAYYGGALGALATGVAPEGYQARPKIPESVAALTAYLRAGEAKQPLHNRLFLLWASAKLRDLLPDSDRQSILAEIWRKQQPDGGWTLESLGQWKHREKGAAVQGIQQLRHGSGGVCG